jgi:hypothetical protein
MSRQKLIPTALVLAVVFVTGTRQTLAAPRAQEGQALIISPAAGSVVAGPIDIIGTAAHPQITVYEVFYAPGPEATGASQWVSIARVEGTGVQNGPLAAWDTTTVPDGVYTLAISVWWEGGGQVVRFTNGITVRNVEASPTPPPTETPTPLDTAVPTTPTSVPVELPPTATPRAAPTTGPGETPSSAPAAEEGEESPALNTAQLRAAFLDGVRITLLLFGLWGAYAFGKAIIRYLIRSGGIDLPWRKK